VKAVRIYVSNFPLTTTEKELRLAFAAFGHVQSTQIIKEKGSGQPRFAFVEMSSADEAHSAIQGLNGKSLNGAALLVNQALTW
jgi:cold-inducible RNA-binding protein